MLQAAALAAEPLRNASPIMAGGEDGLSPMSFGLTYSNYPKGFAYISTEEAPDIFVLVKSGTADARGFWWCRYDCRTPDGHQVYRKPVRCKTPWDGGKDIPSVIKVFQDGADIWLLRLTTKRIETARWNGYDGFEAEEVLPLEGIDHRINSFDCIRRDLNTIEIVLLCNDGKSYRPETFKGDTQSYYDGAGIYRGELPAAGVFRFHVDNGWHQVSDVGQVSDDMRVIIGPGEIAAVDAGDGCYGGYVVTNLLGSMKFIPYMERIPKGGIHPFHIRDEKGNVLVHKAYSSRLISVADVFKVHDLQAVLFMQEAGIRESPVRRRVRRTLDGADKKVCLSVHVPVDEPQLAPAFLSESFPCIVVACDLASVLKPQFSGILYVVVVHLPVKMKGIIFVHYGHDIHATYLCYGRPYPPCPVQFKIIHHYRHGGGKTGLCRSSLIEHYLILFP